MENEFNAILEELSRPAQNSAELNRRIELCQRALFLLPKVGNEILWAQLQRELGSSLAQAQLANQSADMQEAIDAYQQALTVMTRTTMPIDWATTMMNLGL